MTTNIGTVDRVLRIVAGAVLIGAALGLLGPAYRSVWGWVGLVPLATALASWCPLYTVLGVRTCKVAPGR